MYYFTQSPTDNTNWPTIGDTQRTKQTTDDVTTDETTDETTAAGGPTLIQLPTGGGKRKISFNKRLKNNQWRSHQERRHMILSPSKRDE